MNRWLWQDEGGRVGVRNAPEPEESEIVDDPDGDYGDGIEATSPQLEICVDDDVCASLDADAARELIEALEGWMPAPESEPVAAPEGTFYQVYYRHEYTDDDGDVLPLTALGEANELGAYTWNAEDLDGVEEHARRIGEELAKLHERRTGESYGPNVEERARAWISVFQMPDDERIWKGFWDELTLDKLVTS